MYDDRMNLTRQVEQDLREFFEHKVFETVIPRSIRLAEAPSFGKPILAYDVRSRGAESYIQLAKEILAREQNAGQAQRKVLGKGLSALLASKPAARVRLNAEPAREPQGPRVASIPISQIAPNPLQPRTVFDATRLQELANSIETNGIIQPILVRRKAGQYELIAGERRLRAAKLAGLLRSSGHRPGLCRRRILEIALIENIQREDLNPIETAQALDRLSREMNLSHEEIADRTGKDRTTITNMIRLLRLPGDVQLLVAERRLSMGHARAILGLAIA